MRVLFVCSGNICRSPMAAAYMRHRAAEIGLAGLEVDSAGLLGIERAPASAEAVEVLAEGGIDLSAHRSKGVRDEHVDSADLVVVMALHHLDEMDRRFAGQGARELLRAFEGQAEPRRGAPDLDDPIGQSIERYRECFAVIRRSVDHLLRHIDSR